jgi:hypothetical protein
MLYKNEDSFLRLRAIAKGLEAVGEMKTLGLDTSFAKSARGLHARILELKI